MNYFIESGFTHIEMDVVGAAAIAGLKHSGVLPEDSNYSFENAKHFRELRFKFDVTVPTYGTAFTLTDSELIVLANGLILTEPPDENARHTIWHLVERKVTRHIGREFTSFLD